MFWLENRLVFYCTSLSPLLLILSFSNSVPLTGHGMMLLNILEEIVTDVFLIKTVIYMFISKTDGMTVRCYMFFWVFFRQIIGTAF